MIDIGQYNVTKQDEAYIVTEMLSGKERRFNSVRDMLDWIERDIQDVLDGQG